MRHFCESLCYTRRHWWTVYVHLPEEATMRNSKHLLFNAVACVRVAGGHTGARPVASPKVDRSAQIDAMFARLHDSTDFTVETALKDYGHLIKSASK